MHLSTFPKERTLKTPLHMPFDADGFLEYLFAGLPKRRLDKSVSRLASTSCMESSGNSDTIREPGIFDQSDTLSLT
jgi:hypothetical protein